MTKHKFTPIVGDLSRLTDEQQRDYVSAACDFLQVPPELGLVVLAHMDVGDGGRQLLLYVRKGATDIIRERHKISTIKLEQFNTEGCVGWTATGQNKEGRQEIAVGAVSIKGLGAAQVANALKTAQTQACRRMTLQFMGGGFLDESEIDSVKATTVNIANAPQSLTEISHPQTTINAGAGQDITDASKEVISESFQQESLNSAIEAILPSVGFSEEIPVPRKRRLSRKTVSLDSSTTSEAAIPQLQLPSTKFVELAPQTLSADSQSTQRFQENRLTNQEGRGKVEVAEPKKEPIAHSEDVAITKEQENELKEKLSKYVNEILPQAGFIQSEGQSRSAKMRLFVKKMIPDVNTKTLTANQWATFFNFMDSKLQEIGAKGLVDLINAQIGG